MSTAVLFAEAVDTARTLVYANAAWLVLLAIAATAAGFACVVAVRGLARGLWRACRGLSRGLQGAQGGLEGSRVLGGAPEVVESRTAIQTPSWARTEQEAA